MRTSDFVFLLSFIAFSQISALPNLLIFLVLRMCIGSDAFRGLSSGTDDATQGPTVRSSLLAVQCRRSRLAF